MCLPRCLRALASWSAARSSRWRSAFSTTTASRSSGRSAKALRMASACSTWIRPAARAVRVRSRPSRPVASRIARWAAGRVVRVRWACQLAVEVAPVAAATSMRSAWASSRVSSSASWALAAWTSSRVAVVSSGSIDQSGTVATEARVERTPATAVDTRWGWFAIAVMGQFQHRPPTLARSRNALVDKGFRCFGCGRKVAFQRGLRWSRQARPAVGPSVLRWDPAHP